MKVTIHNLRERYAWNDTRSDLLACLERDLEKVAHALVSYRVVIYGSFVSNKDEPRDIDVLLTGNFKPGEFPPISFVSGSHVHWKTYLSEGHSPSLPSAEQMVVSFNSEPANRAKGIEVKEWVELVTGEESLRCD